MSGEILPGDVVVDVVDGGTNYVAVCKVLFNLKKRSKGGI